MGTIFSISAPDVNLATIYNKISYVFSSAIATSLFYFFLTYPENIKPKRWLTSSLIIAQLSFSYFILFTNTIIGTAFKLQPPAGWGWHFGTFSFVYILFFATFFLSGVFIMYKKYKRSLETNVKKNISMMIVAITIGVVPPFFMCDLLPRIGYFDLNWLGPVSGCLWVFIIVYSIIRYRQMNIRAIIAEVLAIAMAIIFFINIFVNIPWGIWDNVIGFIAFTTLLVFLLQNIMREDRQKELLHDLNNSLEQKVSEQTREIRKSYNLEKMARRELEKLNEMKDQFIMITQHHLRSPVMSIKSDLETISKSITSKHSYENPNILGANMIYDKTDMKYARIPKETENYDSLETFRQVKRNRNAKVVSSGLEQSLTNAEKSIGRLGKIVDDFLDITTLKPGSQILNINRCNIGAIIEDVIQELWFHIEKMDLTLNGLKDMNLSGDTENWPDLMVDGAKMREAIIIIIENAVKYNTFGGSITIRGNMTDNMFEIAISNTGIGIGKEDREKIFNKNFFRSEDARRQNPIGMGIGLSVARAIIRAHGGDISLESEGKGKGAIVKLRLGN
jgi:signal transduction histidine kinase